jgi:hypothetical protein
MSLFDAPQVIVGVDPGASGAIAGLDLATGDIVFVVDMPEQEGVVSAPLCADVLAAHEIAVAWVEKVGAMPKQGVASSFKFGRAYGTIHGVLGGARIPVVGVHSSKWKPNQGVTADKETSRRKAIELWPAHSALFARKKDNGRAEACLIARYGWLQQRQAVA